MALDPRALLERFRLSADDLAALRKSAVLKLWLKNTWSAWLVGILYSVFAQWVFPALMRPALRLIWPPNKGHGIQRLATFLNNSLVEDEHVDRALAMLAPIVWLVGFSLLMALLELKIRPAIAEASRIEASRPRAAVTPPVEATMVADGGAIRRIGARGRYRLEKELARGGMGVVWRGFDTVLERRVAVKELPATNDPGLKDRFRQEALALARLSHANVVQVYDFLEEADERLYIAMELVDGGDLDSLLRTGPLSLPRSLEIARQVALGLAAAHKRGIVHRDVKPLNVLVTSDGTVKVTDFGLAKLAEATAHTVEGSVLGSPRYMSPEQAAGKPADARSDVYSFGATLFHLLAGKPPFEGDTASVLAQHLTQRPPTLSEVQPGAPRALDPLVAAMLEKDPDQRPQSRDDVAAKLSALR